VFVRDLSLKREELGIKLTGIEITASLRTDIKNRKTRRKNVYKINNGVN
jgi:hypothetical protein